MTQSSTDITKVEPVDNSPMAIISQLATNKDVDPEKLAALMELQFKWEDRQAKKSFDLALRKFQRECPDIEKDGKVRFVSSGRLTAYDHARLNKIIKTMRPHLDANGFSTRWTTKREQGDDRLYVGTVLTHCDGHSESTFLPAPPDGGGSKNAVQAIGSSTTYLQRYTTFLATGLTPVDDDDGRALTNIDSVGKILREAWTERRRQLDAPEEHDNATLKKIISVVLSGQPVRYVEQLNKVHQYIFIDGVFDIITGEEIPAEDRAPEPKPEAFE